MRAHAPRRTASIWLADPPVPRARAPPILTMPAAARHQPLTDGAAVRCAVGNEAPHSLRRPDGRESLLNRSRTRGPPKNGIDRLIASLQRKLQVTVGANPRALSAPPWDKERPCSEAFEREGRSVRATRVNVGAIGAEAIKQPPRADRDQDTATCRTIESMRRGVFMGSLVAGGDIRADGSQPGSIPSTSPDDPGVTPTFRATAFTPGTLFSSRSIWFGAGPPLSSRRAAHRGSAQSESAV